MDNHWDYVSYHASFLLKYDMAPRCVSELFRIKSTHQHQKNCDFELRRFDTVVCGKHLLHYQGPFICLKVSDELRKKLN